MKLLEHKVPPLATAALTALVMWVTAQDAQRLDLTTGVNVLAISIPALLGIIFIGLGVLSFRRAKTTLNPRQPDKANTLVSHGVYRLTRNPMYLGFAFLLLSWSAYLAVPASLVGLLAFMLYITRFQILPEERAMQAKFGQSYLAYCAQVRRWL